MKNLMIGGDYSHHNPDQWNGKNFACGEFGIVKATEGATFVDPAFRILVARAKSNKSIPNYLGVYHFLSEKSGIAEQIIHFVNTVQPLKGKAILALDYEAGFASSDPTGKCLKAAIEQLKFYTEGAQIFIYMNENQLRKIERSIPEVLRDNYICLWLASYDNKYEANIKPPIIQQITSTPWDIDVFYGSNDSWLQIANSW